MQYLITISLSFLLLLCCQHKESNVEQNPISENPLSSPKKDVRISTENGQTVKSYYRNDSLIGKKIISDNGLTRFEYFKNEKKWGSVKVFNIEKELITYEYWLNDSLYFKCDYNDNKNIVNYSGIAGISTYNNLELVELNDTVWIHTYLVPIPESKVKVYIRNLKDSTMLSKTFEMPIPEPIINYYIYELNSNREMIFEIMDAKSSKRIDIFKFKLYK